jgi:hypothetical protein
VEDGGLDEAEGGHGRGAPSEEGCEAALDALLDGGEGERGIIKKNTAAR